MMSSYCDTLKGLDREHMRGSCIGFASLFLQQSKQKKITHWRRLIHIFILCVLKVAMLEKTHNSQFLDLHFKSVLQYWKYLL